MRPVLCLLLVAPVLACANLYHEAHHVAASNQLALADLQPGMTLVEVMNRMRSDEVRLREGRSSAAFVVGNPHHSTTVELLGGEPAQVLYYYTGPKSEDGVATSDELTPLVLSEGRFAGSGWEFLEREAVPEALAEVRRQEMEREIREARQLEARRPGYDPLEQDFREELGRASTLIRMMLMPGF